MLISAVPFREVWSRLHPRAYATSAVVSFVTFLEKRLGGKFVFDTHQIPFGRTDLIDLFEIASTLQATGVIEDVFSTHGYSDEPRFYKWAVRCNTPDAELAGGISLLSDRDALIPALAEALERFLWMTQTDYLGPTKQLAFSEMAQHGDTLDPKQFVGWSEAQRAEFPELAMDHARTYLWTEGYSHTKKRPVWIPAQAVCGSYSAHVAHSRNEPMIRTPITSGLATGPTEEFALLNGALEIIERDAFMITWVNKLSPERVDLSALAENDPHVQTLLDRCAKYRLTLHAVRLPTDAPAHAICAIAIDDSGHEPRVTVGLKAHRSLTAAVLGASLEALRGRQSVRHKNKEKPLAEDKKPSDLVHMERAQYWGTKGPADLDFLIARAPETVARAPWEGDSVNEHWERIVSWCREKGYACASVDVGKSSQNPTPWRVKMVVMPEIQPVHQTERFPYTHGTRLREVPKQFGFTPLETPFSEPHPFA